MGKKRSEVWNHYKPLEGSLKALCRYCDQTVSILGGSISNLTRHLKKKHQKLCLERLLSGEVVSFSESHEHQLTHEGSTNEDETAQANLALMVEESISVEASAAEPKEGTEVLSITTQLPPGARKNKSEVWDHFTKYQSPDQTRRIGKCHYCPKLVSAGGGISNLKRHLVRHHPEEIGEAPTKTKSVPDQFAPLDNVERIDDIETNELSEGQPQVNPLTSVVATNSSDVPMSVSEPSTVTISLLPKKNTRKSRIWAHFTPNETNTKGKCNYCGSLISMCYGSVGNLFRHLKKKHPKVRIKKAPPPSARKAVKPDFVPALTEAGVEPDQVSLTESPAKGGGKRVSAVWNHFTKLRNADNTQMRGECHYCRKLVSASSGSISNLKRHLRKKHPNRLVGGDSCDEESFEPMDAPSPPPKPVSKLVAKSDTVRNEGFQVVCENYVPHSSTTPTPVVLKLSTSGPAFNDFGAPISPEKKKALDRQLVEFICKGFHQPSNFLEGKGFKELMHALNPTYELVSLTEFKNALLPKTFEEIVHEVQAKLNAASAVCLSAEAWTTSKEKHFATLTAHYLVDEGQNLIPRSSMLSCSEFINSYAPENIAVWFQSTVIEWSLESKVIGIVTNNSLEMTMAADFCNWHHIPCFAHILNSIILKGLKAVEEIVTKIRAASEHIRADPQVLNNFYEIQKQLGLPKSKLKVDNPVLWRTTCKMLERFLVNKDCVLPTLTQCNYNGQELQDLSGAWDMVDAIVRILRLFNDVIVDLSEETVGLSRIPILLRIVVDRLGSFTAPANEVEIMRTVILEELNSKLNQADLEQDPLIGHSVLLDPRFKKEGFSSELHFNHFKGTLLNELASFQLTHPSGSQNVTSSQSSSLWADFDKLVKQTVDAPNQVPGHITEMDSYLSESLITRTANPLAWWSDRKAVYHSLYALMLKKLCTPAAAVPFSRLFTEEGYSLTNRRFLLNSSKLVPMIVFLHQNL